MGFALLFQLLNSPTTDTAAALGAHTANRQPSTPFSLTGTGENIFCAW